MFTELHFHTKETSVCGTVSTADSIPEYKAFGYDAVVVTDHFCRNYFCDYYSGQLSWEEAMSNWLKGYRAAKAEGEKCGLKIFLGCEISFDHYVNNDYLVYGLTEEILFKYPELWKMTEAKFKEFSDTHGLFFAQAHPYREWCRPCDPKFLHGTEMFNGHNHHNNQNHLAMQRWLDTKLIPICGTDFHHEDANLGCGVRFGKSADSIQDIVDMLFSRNYELVIPGTYSYTPRG